MATFDVIIYDITVNPEQMKEVVWLGECLEKNSDEFVSKKTLILVTNLMSWVSTKPNDPVSIKCVIKYNNTLNSYFGS